MPIYTVDNNSLVAIKPTTGTLNFSVPIEQGKNVFVNEGCALSPPSSQNPVPPALYQTILAGDGNVYVLYSFENFNTVEADCLGNDSYSSDLHLRLIQVAPDGSSSATIDLGDWNNRTSSARGPGDQFSEQLIGFQSGILPALSPSMLTNSNTGVLVSLGANFGSYCGYTSQWVPRPPNGVSDIYEGCVAATTTYQLAATSGNSVASDVTLGAGIAAPLNPVLELQDGSFVGTVGLGPSPGNVTQTSMVNFNQSGGLLWTVPNFQPEEAQFDGDTSATFDGSSTTSFNAQGQVDGQSGPLLINSWGGNSYQNASGSVQQMTAQARFLASPNYANEIGVNFAQNKTPTNCGNNDLDQLIKEYADPQYNSGFSPLCSQFTPSSNSQPSPHYSFSILNVDDMPANHNDFPDWAILSPAMLTGLEATQVNYNNQLLTISSGYRTPKVQNIINSAEPRDRHIHGDAVDLGTRSVQVTWDALHDAALAAKACVEPENWTGKLVVNHVHADWRPASLCLASWRK